MTALYLDTDKADGFREPDFSEECHQRRLEPQISAGLLANTTGVPLMAEAFEGQPSEKLTMIPTITVLIAAHSPD